MWRRQSNQKENLEWTKKWSWNKKKTLSLIIEAKKKNKKAPHKCIALCKVLFNKTLSRHSRVNDSTKSFVLLVVTDFSIWTASLYGFYNNEKTLERSEVKDQIQFSKHNIFKLSDNESGPSKKIRIRPCPRYSIKI